jgi:drug/metabolite transporter (DMT)-like permease
VDNSKKLLGRGALLLTTLIWGISFVLMDFTLDSVPVLYILAIRFIGAAVILLLASVRALRRLDWRTVGYGALMGTVLFLAYAVQTYGLARTTPGKNAFLTAFYCIIVPFLYWLVRHKRPDRYNISAAALGLIGVGLISLNNRLTLGLGDGLTLICGFFYAVHIIVTNRALEGRSVVLLTAVQFTAAGVLATVLAFIFEPMPTVIPVSTVWILVFLTVACTALCLFLQVFGQKHTPPSQAAVILTFESVFGAASSVLFANEILTPKLIAGFVLMFVAVFVSETKLSFFRRKKRIEQEEMIQ